MFVSSPTASSTSSSILPASIISIVEAALKRDFLGETDDNSSHGLARQADHSADLAAGLGVLLTESCPRRASQESIVWKVFFKAATNGLMCSTRIVLSSLGGAESRAGSGEAAQYLLADPLPGNPARRRRRFGATKGPRGKLGHWSERSNNAVAKKHPVDARRVGFYRFSDVDVFFGFTSCRPPAGASGRKAFRDRPVKTLRDAIGRPPGIPATLRFPRRPPAWLRRGAGRKTLENPAGEVAGEKFDGRVGQRHQGTLGARKHPPSLSESGFHLGFADLQFDLLVFGWQQNAVVPLAEEFQNHGPQRHEVIHVAVLVEGAGDLDRHAEIVAVQTSQISPE